MRWVRANVRRGAWCALIALAIQLAVSFGHVHSVRNGPPGAGAIASVLSAPSTDGSGAPSGPAGPAESGFDYCAVCAVINLAGSMMSAAAPVLPVTMAVRSIRFQPGPDRGSPVSARRVFKARAPPLA